MDKKVGLAIVTYGTNYGTYLQAFATQQLIQNLGYKTEVINIDSVKHEVGKARKWYFAKQLFNFAELKSYKNVLLGLVREKVNKKYKSYMANRKEKFKKFREEKFCFSEIVKSWDGLTKLCSENYDHVVVGSDQLWRPANIAGDFYTLNFVPDDVNKIAYATSFGLSEIRKSQSKKTEKFLNRINHLSVRENSGAKIVKKLTNRDIPVVCDPTLMLTKKEWDGFVSNDSIVKGKYVLCYFLGNNKSHRILAKRIAEKTGCKIVGVLHIAGHLAIDENFCDEEPQDIGPFEFLNLIKNAEYVCTDSFHGCVFATIFNRNLFAFKRFTKNSKMSTNSRITTLLSTFGIVDVLVEGSENVDDLLDIKINYNEVNYLMETKREESLDYLMNAFANKETDL